MQGIYLPTLYRKQRREFKGFGKSKAEMQFCRNLRKEYTFSSFFVSIIMICCQRFPVFLLRMVITLFEFFKSRCARNHHQHIDSGVVSYFLYFVSRLVKSQQNSFAQTPNVWHATQTASLSQSLSFIK